MDAVRAMRLFPPPLFTIIRFLSAFGQTRNTARASGHLWAIDATGTGDVTGSHAVWHFGNEDYNRTISTVGISDGLLYAADLSGFVYCLDLKTGTQHWKYDTFAAIWGSPFVADGKVYIGDEMAMWRF